MFVAMETGTNIQCTQVINQTDEARRPQDEFSPSAFEYSSSWLTVAKPKFPIRQAFTIQVVACDNTTLKW